MDKIILIGCGGHAVSCADVIESKKSFIIGGAILKDKKEKKNNDFKILGYEKDLQILKKKYKYAHIAVGQIKNYKVRFELYKKLKKYGFILPTIKSKFCTISPKAVIGEGTIIMHGAIINSNVVIGKNCIINSGSIIEHNVKIGDFNHISTGVIINGDAEIGEKNFIGSGSVIFQKSKITNKNIIPALTRFK